MKRTARRRLITSVVMFSFLGLSGCAELLVAGVACDLTRCLPSAHENFVNSIQHHVGFGVNDPNFSWNRYPQGRGEVRELSNGNDEYEYFWGRRTTRECMVFWEIDK